MSEELKKRKQKPRPQLMRLLFAVALTVLLFGCDIEASNEAPAKKNDSRFEVVTIDSCEYVVFDEVHGYAGAGGITHKGNCKFCKLRGK